MTEGKRRLLTPRRAATVLLVVAAGVTLLVARWASRPSGVPAEGALHGAAGSAAASLAERLAHLGPVRRLRCAGARLPDLDAAPLVIRYGHVGAGAPADDRWLTLDADGARLSTAAGSRSVAVEPGLAQRVRLALLAEDLLCATAVPRHGPRGVEGARETIEVRGRGFVRLLSVDACNGVSDPLAFQHVAALLASAAGTVVDTTGQGARVAQACNDDLLRAVETRSERLAPPFR